MDPLSAMFLVAAFLCSNIMTHIVTENENKKSCEKVKKECKRILELKDNDW